MTGGPILLDTCAVIWLAAGDPMSDEALADIDTAISAGDKVFVSPITAWEIGILSARGRIALSSRPESWFRSLVALPGLSLATMDPDILIASSYLPGVPPKDPADRIIAATAREGGMRLVTRDRLLLDYAAAGYVDAIGC